MHQIYSSRIGNTYILFFFAWQLSKYLKYIIILENFIFFKPKHLQNIFKTKIKIKQKNYFSWRRFFVRNIQFLDTSWTNYSSMSLSKFQKNRDRYIWKQKSFKNLNKKNYFIDFGSNYEKMKIFLFNDNYKIIWKISYSAWQKLHVLHCICIRNSCF